MSVSPANPGFSSNSVASTTANEPSADGDHHLLKKMAEIEFLPDLFALLQRVENGEIKSQDFDNHAGPIRLKLSTLRSHLQEVDGICETVEEREEKIRTLSDCHDRRVSFLNDFKNRVLTDLDTIPAEDHGLTPANGYKQYPHGPARHESSVQRGSVQFLGGIGAAPGDPTTPGYASKGDVERQDPHASIGKIPVLPVSYREVKPILEKLNGQGQKAPKGWVGELEGFDYSLGPHPNVTLNLYSNQIFNITPLWNVYAKIEGENKDEVIIIGIYRDAWIKGRAGDPNSGSAALIETRAIEPHPSFHFEICSSSVM